MNEQLKEIALRVAGTVSAPYISDESILRFAEHFLSALPKPEPVAWEWVEPESGLCIGHNEPPEYAAYCIKPLYTTPPDQSERIAELERENEGLRKDAERYRWLRTSGLQRAWVYLGTDCDGDNFAEFKCEFRVPEPPNLPYEDDEGLEWADKDFDAAIDAALATKEKS